MNRVRVGKHTNEDLAMLKMRVRAKNHADLQTASLYIMYKRKPCSEVNDVHLNSLNRDLVTAEAKDVVQKDVVCSRVREGYTRSEK